MTAAPLQPAAPHQGVLARHPLTFYFIIAYAGTWLVTVPVALSANGVGLLPFGIPNASVFFVSAVWVFLGPTLAAFIVTGATEGREGIRSLLRRYVLWRVGLRWYLVVLLGPPAIILLATIVLPGALASFKTLAPLDPLPLLFSFPLVLIFGGALFEEGGWRGFALPRLQRLHGPLVGTLILGILWACWHLPLFWVTVWGTPPTILNMVLYIPSVIFMTIIFTWVFNTHGTVDEAELNNMRVHATPLLMIEISEESPHEPAPEILPQRRCRAYGRCGEGHLVIHIQKERRYRCKRCGRTFTETKDTAFYRMHKPKWLVLAS